MPEDSKKQQKKGKSDAKEQRKQRQPRHHNVPAASDKKIEKKTEKPEVTVPNVIEKPVIEEPGPEFYKNLKRETDEILKITEEANLKYKKKEIQSNWSKYEIPIESYEDIEEQENLGADYEKLIEAPLSIGGHFQFKHEKAWNIDIGPSLYDKYFEINMDNLGLALQTVPFYERNDLDKNIFSESDILTMNNRATRYKQKFCKVNSFTTPELIAQEEDSLKDDFVNVIVNDSDKICDKIDKQQHKGLGDLTVKPNIRLEEVENKIRIESGPRSTAIQETKLLNTIKVSTDNEAKGKLSQVENDFDEIFLGVKPIQTNVTDKNSQKLFFETPVVDAEKKQETKPALATATVCPEKEQKNQIIESPEDLEKWLDEFLE